MHVIDCLNQLPQAGSEGVYDAIASLCTCYAGGGDGGHMQLMLYHHHP